MSLKVIMQLLFLRSLLLDQPLKPIKLGDVLATSEVRVSEEIVPYNIIYCWAKPEHPIGEIIG